jgi:saccharopine dehydrogenase (NAD+, L-lysine-forming)
MYHEELESLTKHFPTIKRARFWMTFGQEYLTHLRVIQDIGMARIDPIDYNGQKIVPIQFLKAVLPNPGDLGKNYTGETSIGCRIRGMKDGKEQTYYVYNNCSHHAAYLETGAGRKLHDRRSGHDRSQDVPQGTMEESWSTQCRRI